MAERATRLAEVQVRRRRCEYKAREPLEPVRPSSTSLACALAHDSFRLTNQNTDSSFCGLIAAETPPISYNVILDTGSSCVLFPSRLALFVDFALAAETFVLLLMTGSPHRNRTAFQHLTQLVRSLFSSLLFVLSSLRLGASFFPLSLLFGVWKPRASSVDVMSTEVSKFATDGRLQRI